MTFSRSTTFVAIAFGALLGAAGAVMSQHHDTSPAPEPPLPPITRAASPRPVPPGSATDAAEPVEASSAVAPPADPVAEAIAPLQQDPDALLHTELHCARGNPDECLLVGDFYARSDKGDHKKRALIYRRRAIVLYAEKCHDRWPAACYILSRLYEKGIGVPSSSRTADALLQRSLELCKAHPSRPCVTEGATVPPDLR